MQGSEARILKTFGRELRGFRKRGHFSQEGLAEAAGLSRNYISDIERGVRNPSLLALVSLARALRVTVGELVGEVEPKLR